MTADAPIFASGLQKHYGVSLIGRIVGKKGVHALRGVDIEARPGEIFGLLGPNGAGKSTLVKSLLGLVKPTGGTCSMLGKKAGSTAARRDVGYLPEQAKFPPYLTGRQTVTFFAGLGGLTRREAAVEADRWLDRLGLTEAADRRVGGYSKGMRQRVGLAQALAAGRPGKPPGVLILDEPTDGVDPMARKLIRDVLSETRDSGTCVFLNSHLLGELELICDRAAVMVNGRVATSGTPTELAGGRGSYRITLAENQPRPTVTHAKAAFQPDGSISVDTIDAAEAVLVVDELRQAGVVLESFVPVRPTLEDLFMDAVQRDAAEHPAPAVGFPVIQEGAAS